MESWTAAPVIGQLTKKQVKKAFVQEFDDIFWVHDEVSDAWIARRFKGGRRLTKGPRKGRRKGTKGGKNGHMFVPFMR